MQTLLKSRKKITAPKKNCLFVKKLMYEIHTKEIKIAAQLKDLFQSLIVKRQENTVY